MENYFFRWFILALASLGFISYLPYKIVSHKKWKGSGLLGSLLAWGIFWFLPQDGILFWGIFFTGILLSIPISHFAEKYLEYDDPRIVIDELAGVWIASVALPREIFPMILALILFRVFDVFKGPWGKFMAKAPGGLGVVADDILAGIIANLLIRLILIF